MARYSFVGTATRIVVLLLLVIILAIGGMLWLDFLGVITARDYVTPVLKLIGLQRRTEIDNTEDLMLREKQEYLLDLEALKIKEEELVKQAETITSQAEELEQKVADLEKREKDLEERENSFNEKLKAFENRRDNLKQSAEYFNGMKPQDAVEILLEMDDTDIVDIFRITEEQAQAEDRVSLVSYWLSLMPEKRAADLTRKMTKKLNE